MASERKIGTSEDQGLDRNGLLKLLLAHVLFLILVTFWGFIVSCAQAHD